jgi:DNA-directed RNA polymerase specialized sigma24 family protein
LRDQGRWAPETLSLEQVKPLKLAYFSDYTHIEIAMLMHLSSGTEGQEAARLQNMHSSSVLEAAGC